MTKFELPAINPDANPEFTDTNSCAAWLETVPLVNVGPSHSRLLGQLEEFNGFDLEPSQRLRTLELLLEPVAFVQAEHSKKFTAKPIPLIKNERDIFHNVVALWDAFLQGYQRCLNSIAEGNPAISGDTAMVCQRTLWCAGQRLAEYYKSCQELGSEDWAVLHRLFAVAEGYKVLDKQVPEPALQGRVTTCLQSYVRPLLLHLANDPSEQTPKQLAIISRWLESWSQKVRIARTPTASALGLPPIAVDIAAGRGPVRGTVSGESARFLELDELSKGVQSRIALLRKGDTPEKLGLGDDISAAGAEQLLVLVHYHWCEEPRPRASVRHAVTASAQVCARIPAMHYFIGGKIFRQPGEAKELSKAQREEIATFGRIATRQDDDYSMTHGYALESWTIREESLGGLRVERAEDGGKGRFVQQQLIAVKPADAKGFILGIIRWLSVSEDFVVRCGVRMLPGAPQCVAVRGTGLNAMTEKYIQGLLLPAVPALKSPTTLILPGGWFRPKRMLEVYSDKAEEVLLTGVVDRGADFERIAISAP